MDQRAANPDTLFPLPLEVWERTKDTLHLWCQIIGKTRLAVMPMRNHWWNVTLYPSTRGLTTHRMPVEVDNLEIDLDLVDHRLQARTRQSAAGFALHDGLSVADFHRSFSDALSDLQVPVDIRATPYGLPTTTPFAIDREHASYDPAAVARFLHALQWTADVLEEGRPREGSTRRRRPTRRRVRKKRPPHTAILTGNYSDARPHARSSLPEHPRGPSHP